MVISIYCIKKNTCAVDLEASLDKLRVQKYNHMKTKAEGSGPRSMEVVKGESENNADPRGRSKLLKRGIAKVLRSLTLGAYLALNAQHPIINVSMTQ
jgi:hypothetical protein